MAESNITEIKSKFSGFHDLIKFRVREILLVSSLYDAFVLEEDGRLAERIFSEYVDLNLHFIPRITKVSTAEAALATLQTKSFDLVITMARISDMNPLEFGKKVKELDPEKVVVLLSYDPIDPVLLKKIRQVKSIDKVFYWYGESKLMLAIIKYVEDLKNAPEDVSAGVQVILIVEDSPKYYSMFLPIVYTEIMLQTRKLISTAVNDLHRMLRMRARPKILMAESFEEGLKIFETFKHNLLGIISDLKFPHKGKLDPEAGFILARKLKKEVPDLPILIQSAEPEKRSKAEQHLASFLDKNSPNLLLELRSFILSHFGFGDFVFRYPNGHEICRAPGLSEFADRLLEIPGESLEFHAQRNHISIWLRARTEFEIADEIRPKKISDFKNIEELRLYIYEAIMKLLRGMQQGVIKDFLSTQLYMENSFIRIGSGSLGGKGRGLAFVNAMLATNSYFSDFRDIDIKTPQTFVLGTEVYEDFIEQNNLQEFAIQTTDEQQIVDQFLTARFPDNVYAQLETLLVKIKHPLAVRSSSLLEDSQLLPFAGMYKTLMLPNNHPDLKVRLQQLVDAIKTVYASVFFREPKEYVKNTDYRIEEEKMAVVIQQYAGIKYDKYYYPVISGVAQSFNYYPVYPMKPEEGVVHLALGLGKIIADGERIFQFSPKYPKMNLPYNSPTEMLNSTQNYFFALNLSNKSVKVTRDDNFSLEKLPLKQAETDGSLFFVGSTYDPANQSIKDTLSQPGPRVVTFANILKYNIFPLPDLITELLKVGQNAFGTHVEIEFALNLYKDPRKKPEFYILQIRPMVAGGEHVDVTIDENDHRDSLISSFHVIGNGVFRDLYDIVFVDPDRFDPAKSDQIAVELEEINQSFIEEDRNYIVLGFGRWGTSDPWLGIPVEWYQVSKARVIIESHLDNFKVEPSLGSHFFHNLVSLRLGYFYIKSGPHADYISWDWLKSRKAYKKTHYLRQLRFDKPITVKIDGRTSQGIIFKPE